MSLINMKYTTNKTKCINNFEDITKIIRKSHETNAIDEIQRDEDVADYIKIGAIKAVRLG